MSETPLSEPTWESVRQELLELDSVSTVYVTPIEDDWDVPAAIHIGFFGCDVVDWNEPEEPELYRYQSALRSLRWYLADTGIPERTTIIVQFPGLDMIPFRDPDDILLYQTGMGDGQSLVTHYDAV